MTMIRAKQARGYALNKAKGTDDIEMKQQLARGEGTAGQRWRSSCLPARLGRRCLACLLADRTASRSQAMSGAR